jgi:hypothetical protein
MGSAMAYKGACWCGALLLPLLVPWWVALGQMKGAPTQRVRTIFWNLTGLFVGLVVVLLVAAYHL